MSAKPNYHKIGIFVLTAVAIGICAVVALGAGNLFRKRIILETCIDQSVQGLDIGSAVRYRGVQIGTVKQIDFVHNHYVVNPKSDIRYVLIRVSLYPDAFEQGLSRNLHHFLEAEVARGLRVRLTAQGITGVSYLEVDYLDPERNVPLPITWQPEYPYIPSAPSTISRLSESVEKILRKVESTRFEVVVEDLHNLLSGLNDEVRSMEMEGLREEIRQFLANASKEVQSIQMARIHEQVITLIEEVRASNQSLQQILAHPGIPQIVDGTARTVQRGEKQVAEILTTLVDASAKVDTASDHLNQLLGSEELRGAPAHLSQTLQRLDRMLGGQQNRIDAIFDNLSKVSDDLRLLVRDARRYPSGTLFGAPPAPIQPAHKEKP